MINPIGFIITILYFKFSEFLRRFAFFKKFPPIVMTGILIILTLEIFNFDFEVYNESASFLTFMLIPATIALGYPIYKNKQLLLKNKRVIYSAFIIAMLIAILGTYIVAKLCHTELIIMEAMLPKSVTAPIAVEISKEIGAIPELTACVVVLTGVFGAMFGHWLLRLVHVKNDVAIGLSIGAASHVVGTSSCIETKREKQIVMASVSFIIVGLIAAVIIPLFCMLMNS